jgi:hypothetical protein
VLFRSPAFIGDLAAEGTAEGGLAAEGTAEVSPAAEGTAEGTAEGPSSEITQMEKLNEEMELEIVKEAMLTPAIMVEEPRLTEEDFQIYFKMCDFILFGSEPLLPSSFIKIAEQYGVTFRRLNYIAAKIPLPLGNQERIDEIINQLGPGVLLDGQEKELFNTHRQKLEEISLAMEKSIMR